MRSVSDQIVALSEPSGVAEAPTLLRRVVDRTPALVDAAFSLHGDRKLSPNRREFDLDAVAANVEIVARTTLQEQPHDVRQTKQDNRNPTQAQMTRSDIAPVGGIAAGVRGARALRHRQERAGRRLRCSCAGRGEASDRPAARAVLAPSWR
jgi:hypothetical protein